MQGLAADVPEVGIVEKVPGKGMADIFHMDTDLVGASCLKTETQERQIRVFIIQKPFIPGGRGLSVVRVRDPLDGRALLPPDGDGDRSAGICFPTDSGQIFPADLPALHLAGEKGGASPAAPGDARMPEGSPAPVPGAVSSVSAGHRAEGEANGTARPAASPVAGAPCPAPSSGTGMGRREAAFRQWAADMQARFDAGLEAEEDRAARHKDSLVVLPPPADTGGRKRRTAKKAQADAAEAPRPRTWITRRRSTEPGHEARFEEWHGPARTGSVLEKVFISLGASPEQAKLSRLWRSWDAVLGPDLAPLARPLGHHDDKLLIGAEDAVLLQELYYIGPEIVRRVNEFLQEDFFTAVKVSLMLDHQDLDAPSPVLERSAGRPKEEVPAPSGASLGLMDPESAVARCYARFLGMELPDPRK